MSDNYTATPGVGITFGSDEVDSVQYPRLKPVWGINGAVVDTSATNPLPVTAYDGGGSITVDGVISVVTVTPTLTVAATYVANDFVGTSSTAMTIAAARINDGTGVIQSAILIDYALQSISTELWLFDASVTPPLDSAAWSISDADALKCIGVISFSTYYASALNSVAVGSFQPIAFKAAAGTQNIYGCLVTRGAPSYATGNVSIRLSILQD